MAYEVVKTVRGRAYRYEVRSERDPVTGKTRNRWTYMGRVGTTAAAGGPSRPRANAREALLDALERLLERSSSDAVTAAGVSAEAGLAHGTFYRYFRNKAGAIHAVMERLRMAGERPGAKLLPAGPETMEAARAALRAWTEYVLRAPVEHPGVLRAWYELAAKDAVIGAARRERRDSYADALAAHIRELHARGFSQIEDAANTAAVLFSMIDGFYREAIVNESAVDEARVMAALDLIERGVFGSL